MKQIQTGLVKVLSLRRAGRALLVLALLLLMASVALRLAQDVALAQSGGYDLSWFTVDGGGATFSQGGGYSLGGTAGQPDAGELAGGSYTLNGGFWYGGAAAAGEGEIYLPIIMRNYRP